jgi:hypothetical protein
MLRVSCEMSYKFILRFKICSIPFIEQARIAVNGAFEMPTYYFSVNGIFDKIIIAFSPHGTIYACWFPREMDFPMATQTERYFNLRII